MCWSRSGPTSTAAWTCATTRPGCCGWTRRFPTIRDAILDTPAGEVLRAVARGDIPEVATERRTGEIEVIRPEGGRRDSRDAG